MGNLGKNVIKQGTDLISPLLFYFEIKSTVCFSPNLRYVIEKLSPFFKFFSAFLKSWESLI